MTYDQPHGLLSRFARALVFLFGLLAASASAECIRITAISDTHTGKRFNVIYLLEPAKITRLVGEIYLVESTNPNAKQLKKGDGLIHFNKIHMPANSALEATCAASSSSCVKVGSQDQETWIVFYPPCSDS